MSTKKIVSRRSFVKGALATSALSMATTHSTAHATSTGEKFKLKYAPAFGMFKEHAGKDAIDQIKFADEQGFRAIFDNGIMNKSIGLQEKIGNRSRGN